MAQGSNYPGYEYLQKYMEHYDALKKEGKNKITAEEFLKGNKLEVGSNIYKDV